MAELLLIFRRERRKKTMINIYEVTETNQMIAEENLDVRTITLGISLMDCIDSDLQKLNENIYNKITTMAKNLVSTGDEIEHEFGIPIVNKRISITPISLIGAAACKSPEDFVTIAKTLDRAAKEVGVNFIGGYSALVSKGMTKSEEKSDPFHSGGAFCDRAYLQLCECRFYEDRNQYGRSQTLWRDCKRDSRSDKRE